VAVVFICGSGTSYIYFSIIPSFESFSDWVCHTGALVVIYFRLRVISTCVQKAGKILYV